MFCQQWNDGNRKDQNYTPGQGVSKVEETGPGAVVDKAVEEVWPETMIAVSQTEKRKARSHEIIPVPLPFVIPGSPSSSFT